MRLKQFYSFILILIFMSCDRKSESVSEDEIAVISREEVEKIERGELKAEESLVFSRSELKGMKLFMKKCNHCHPAGEKGEGPSLVDKKLPDFVMHFQVRQGLGDMPSFKKDELSKEDIKKIILFVKILREWNEAQEEKH